jgi:hypothetical protein
MAWGRLSKRRSVEVRESRRVENRPPVCLGDRAFKGSASFVFKALDGSVVTTSTTLTSSGTAAATQACDTATPKQLRFGFEDATKWTSNQALLSTVASPKTEGCFAMGVAGAGYMTIQSPNFPTGDAGAGVSRLNADLFIPTSQPNKFWLGAVQSFLDCPSANLFNAYIGQVDLTGRPVGKFATLAFFLPQNVRAALAGNWNDCTKLARIGFLTTCVLRTDRLAGHAHLAPSLLRRACLRRSRMQGR